jgi:hypothetical protein
MKFERTQGGNNRPVLPEGEYICTVVSAEEVVSKAGNAMVKLVLTTIGPDGNPAKLFDYLVSSEGAVWKIEQFCTSAGLEDKLQAEELEALDCEGREVQAAVVVEESEQYGVQNKVTKYLGTPYSRSV